MIKFIDEKCSGKTKKLLLAAAETGGVVASRNPYGTRTKAIAYGINISNLDFVSYEGLCDYKDDSNIYIDELEQFVQFLFGGGLAGYSMSKED